MAAAKPQSDADRELDEMYALFVDGASTAASSGVGALGGPPRGHNAVNARHVQPRARSRSPPRARGGEGPQAAQGWRGRPAARGAAPPDPRWKRWYGDDRTEAVQERVAHSGRAVALVPAVGAPSGAPQPVGLLPGSLSDREVTRMSDGSVKDYRVSFFKHPSAKGVPGGTFTQQVYVTRRRSGGVQQGYAACVLRDGAVVGQSEQDLGDKLTALRLAYFSALQNPATFRGLRAEPGREGAAFAGRFLLGTMICRAVLRSMPDATPGELTRVEQEVLGDVSLASVHNEMRAGVAAAVPCDCNSGVGGAKRRAKCIKAWLWQRAQNTAAHLEDLEHVAAPLMARVPATLAVMHEARRRSQAVAASTAPSAPRLPPGAMLTVAP